MDSSNTLPIVLAKTFDTSQSSEQKYHVVLDQNMFVWNDTYQPRVQRIKTKVPRPLDHLFHYTHSRQFSTIVLWNKTMTFGHEIVKILWMKTITLYHAHFLACALTMIKHVAYLRFIYSGPDLDIVSRPQINTEFVVRILVICTIWVRLKNKIESRSIHSVSVLKQLIPQTWILLGSVSEFTRKI